MPHALRPARIALPFSPVLPGRRLVANADDSGGGRVEPEQEPRRVDPGAGDVAKSAAGAAAGAGGGLRERRVSRVL